MCVLFSTYCVRPTVPRKNTVINYFYYISTVSCLVVKVSGSRYRVTWFEFQPLQPYLFFICFIYFKPTSKLNDNIIITYNKFVIRCSNEKILYDGFQTSTKNLARKRETSSATPIRAYCVVHYLIR